jgi:class 3 adenylate cyclase
MTESRPSKDAAGGPGGFDKHRTRLVLLANTRQELLAPVNRIREVADALLRDADERGPEAFAADLRKIHEAAGRLAPPLESLLDPGCDPASLLDREARHHLRTPLNHILGYCELWIEDAEAELLEGFISDLHKIHGLAKGLLAKLDEAARVFQKASKPDFNEDDSVLPEMIKGVVEALTARAGREREPEKGRILVVDDNEDNRDVLSRWLCRDGHTVEEAGDGAQALERARAAPPDLILLDIIMPNVNGIEALAQLRADPKLAHIPVIMISAFDQIDMAVHCIVQGAEDYLPKPCNPVLLKARVGACLEKKLLRDREVLLREEIERQRRRSDELLHGILPAEVIGELKETGAVKPRRFEGVAVFFCDIVNFTPFCDRNTPELVVQYLQQLIETWEQLAQVHQVEKIKTIGDSFMAAAGLLRRTDDHPVLHAVRCGQAMIAATRALPNGWDLRVGIHWGPVIAGVIGRQAYLFDLWGDTVNTAARMESNGVSGSVVLSGTAWQHVAERCRGESRGEVHIKGKGPMEMFRVLSLLGH